MAKELSDWLKSGGTEVLYTEDKIDAQSVKKFAPEIIVSYSYRYILKRDILTIPARGAINLHISHLPWNRGADPNIWSYIDNTLKGVTIHYMDEGIDTGDILLQKKVWIDEEQETLKSSYDMLHREIQGLFKANWEALRMGSIKSKPQSNEGSLHYKKDSGTFEQLIAEKGWSMPIKLFRQRLVLLKRSQ